MKHGNSNTKVRDKVSFIAESVLFCYITHVLWCCINSSSVTVLSVKRTLVPAIICQRRKA